MPNKIWSVLCDKIYKIRQRYNFMLQIQFALLYFWIVALVEMGSYKEIVVFNIYLKK